jgi:hypothetical protein
MSWPEAAFGMVVAFLGLLAWVAYLKLAYEQDDEEEDE